MQIAVFVSGRGSNMQALLDAQAAGKLSARVVGVFSNRAEAPALEIARAHGIPVATLSARAYADREAYDRAVLDRVAEWQAEGAVLAGYMRIVTPAFLAGFPRGVINIHPSLLPAFPGAHGIRDACAWGVRVTGCTVHFVDERVDHGPIIAQRALALPPCADPEETAARLLPLEHETLLEATNLWAEGRLEVQGRRVDIRTS